MGNSVLQKLIERGPFGRPISLPQRRDRLHVMPTSTGHEIATSRAYDWDGRLRGPMPFSVLQHTISGEGRLNYERHHYRLRAGETMLVVIPHHHRYWVDDGGRWEFFWIAMTGQEALRLHHAIIAAIGPVFRLKPATIDHLAQCSLELNDSALETPGEASARAYAATMALYDDLLGPHETASRTSAHRLTERVVMHIRKNLASDLDVQMLADLAGLSRAHFTRVFASCEGSSPAEFVQLERMRRAARLLTSGTLSIKAIATNCGFDDPNYFAKVFRRTYGISPSQFRSTGMYSVPSGRGDEG
ncbi:AraC family transcriptional regulator [Pararobbsia alpina]|uniref:HTH-type transcriptional activator RhaR n=1 Tax=Pararobbsia alpina TaxID=621374 RepID=A0A6S7BRW3_9BURK|nr:AraC family transcriptional regulator [Pararobbsia alpina]CAB3800397.1 HTH-type transcriptional activator RhaR [Pararobbsia alpina]